MLPNDPVMLLSVINMKLRDTYSSLEDLCEDMDVSKEDIENKLKKINYEYDAQCNQFK